MDKETLHRLNHVCGTFTQNIDDWIEQNDTGMIKVTIHEMQQVLNEL